MLANVCEGVHRWASIPAVVLAAHAAVEEELQVRVEAASRSPSLLVREKTRLLHDSDPVVAVLGSFPTQRRHSSASPTARSHLPISRGGRPASFAQARFE